jgi:hypothetical protein
MQHLLNSFTDFEQIKNTEKAFILYITDGTCNVGESITPKLEKLITEQFPKLPIYYTYTSQQYLFFLKENYIYKKAGLLVWKN